MNTSRFLFILLFGLLVISLMTSGCAGAQGTTSITIRLTDTPAPSNTPMPSDTPVPSTTPTIPPTPFPEKLKLNDVQIGENELTINCEGTGEPTIILENGLDYVSWKQNSLRRFTHLGRTCRYNRAGLAGKAVMEPRTTNDQVIDLHTLLSQIGVPGPYILVGHSIAGFNMVLYASQYPDEVVGLVCVDCRPPNLDPLMLEKLGPEQPDDPEEIKDLRKDLREGLSSSWISSLEKIDFVASEAQARAVTSLGDLPFIVLVSGGDVWENPIYGDIWKLAWAEASLETAQLSTRGQMEIIEKVGHLGILDSSAVDKAVSKVYGMAAHP